MVWIIHFEMHLNFIILNMYKTVHYHQFQYMLKLTTSLLNAVIHLFHHVAFHPAKNAMMFEIASLIFVFSSCVL